MTFSWLAYSVSESENDIRQVTLRSTDFKAINPNTLTCPIFRTSKDAELTKKIYREFPVIENEDKHQNPWNIKLKTMFHMSSDSSLYRGGEG